VTLATGQSLTLAVELTATAQGTYDAALKLIAVNCADLTVGVSGSVQAQQSAGDGGGGGGCGGCGHASGSGMAPALVVLLVLLARSTRRRA